MKYTFILCYIFIGTCMIASAQTRQIKVDPEQTFQTIDHFTASDAWSGNYVGQYWNPVQKEQIAKWLFSQNMDTTGNPEGIGLSLWRVNLGAGTLEQDSADIVPFQRRAESFLTKDGKSYDWGKSSGQQYFMQKATKYGCNDFLLFSNSPPVPFTKNWKGWSPTTGHANITPEGYGLFAGYLADVAKYFIKEKGWNIRFISPINEPQVNWINPRQEGSPWRNSEMKKLLVHLNQSLAERNLESVKIILAESANLDWLYKDNTNETAKERFGDDGPFNQIQTFFDPASPHYVGDLPYLARKINAHDYHSHKTNQRLREAREKVGEIAKQYDLEYQQSEWCMLPDQKLPMDGFTSDWVPENHTDMQVALLLGRLVYGNMVYANATAWGYWKGMELKGDHALISLFPQDGDVRSGGTVRSNKLLWALGNYSYFIRPGYKRVALDGADDLDTLVSSAYIAPDNSRLVLVFVNSGFEMNPVRLDFPKAFSKRITEVSMFRTDERADLANLHIDQRYTADRQFVMAPRSITTMVFALQ